MKSSSSNNKLKKLRLDNWKKICPLDRCVTTQRSTLSANEGGYRKITESYLCNLLIPRKNLNFSGVS